MIRVGIVATSSVVPKLELEAGIAHLRAQGFQVEAHPLVTGEHFLYPADEKARARALIEFSAREDLDVIWCARGGYGATHLLPYLRRWKKSLRTKRVRPKILIGFSDITSLLEWYRVNLGWRTIHGPMPSMRVFPVLPREEWDPLLNLIRSPHRIGKPRPPLFSLKPVFKPEGFREICAPLVGGNLAVWCALLGTPDQGSTRGKILFLEEIQENLGRIHRMMHHLEQAGGLKGCKGIVLGDFTDCGDSVPVGLSRGPGTGESHEEFLSSPPKDALKPLRRTFGDEEGLRMIFREFGEKLGIPVYSDVPSGHGGRHHSLALGLPYRLARSGRFGLNIRSS
jgi:muramoyltetrapeptide carboxypeptidase